MDKTLIALYDDHGSAQAAMVELESAGYDRGDISLIAHGGQTLPSGADDGGLGDDSVTRSNMTLTDRSGAAPDPDHGAVARAGVAGLGATGGVAAGFGAVAIPGIGPVMAMGPVMGGLTGAGAGTMGGSLMAALADFGVPDEDAHAYSEGLRRGGALVVLHTDDGRVDRAAAVLQRHDPVDIHNRQADWRAGGWTGFDRDAAPLNNDALIEERRRRGSRPLDLSGAQSADRTHGTGLPHGHQPYGFQDQRHGNTIPGTESGGSQTGAGTGFGTAAPREQLGIGGRIPAGDRPDDLRTGIDRGAATGLGLAGADVPAAHERDDSSRLAPEIGSRDFADSDRRAADPSGHGAGGGAPLHLAQGAGGVSGGTGMGGERRATGADDLPLVGDQLANNRVDIGPAATPYSGTGVGASSDARDGLPDRDVGFGGDRSPSGLPGGDDIAGDTGMPLGERAAAGIPFGGESASVRRYSRSGVAGHMGGGLSGGQGASISGSAGVDRELDARLEPGRRDAQTTDPSLDAGGKGNR
ncbi:MAG TPA: hypothetical protein VEH84_09540 [Alphaproteobacteria bacterium]|nr:hypothetical protein [Alphaproteobacteria bacterium]